MQARRALLATGVVAMGLVTAGCEQVARQMVEASARAEARRMEAAEPPRFDDPVLQAMIDRYEADYARYGTDATKLLGEAGGTCVLQGRDAYRVLMGVDYDVVRKRNEEVNAALVDVESTDVTDIDNATAKVVEGRCGANGPEGPAVVVGTLRNVSRLKARDFAQVTVRDDSVRTEGSWQDGVLTGPYARITVFRSAEFEPGPDGQLSEKRNDWDYLDERAEAPSASYVYGELDEAGQPVPGPMVMVVRSPAYGIFTTRVTTSSDAVHGTIRTYSGSELFNEYATRNGQLHGWAITYPHTVKGVDVPGRRDCYQDGELVKALECPSD